jgi:YHYH protein
MITRTKHLVVGLLVVVFLMAGGLVTFLGEEGISSMSFIPHEPALVIDALSVKREVVVLRDTTREDMRASLTERLKKYVNDNPESQVPKEEASTHEEAAVAVLESTSSRCNPQEALQTRNNWGPLKVTLAEGARVISSLAIDDAGLPLNTLQLPLSPVLREDNACLPSSMVGVLLDGTVVMPDTPVVSDAEGLAGYAIDGFPIFGSFEDGKTLVSNDLDTCHGHVHTIVDQGVPTSLYHYHVTDDAPYALGCLRGTF